MKKERIILSLFEVAAWLRITTEQVLALTTLPDDPMPVYDPRKMKFYKPDVENWIHYFGMIAPEEEE